MSIAIPTLETPRLRLLPPDAGCDALYQRFYTDPDASRAYGGPLSPGDAWTRLCADVGAWQLTGFAVWAIQRKAEGDLVGICGFWQGRGWPLELTWWLLPEVRGAGIAREASSAVIAHAYFDFGWDAVETYMKDENLAARALAERLGGGKSRRWRFPDGLERDVYLIPPPPRE